MAPDDPKTAARRWAYLAADYVIPGPFDDRAAPAVAAAEASQARREGIARR